MFALYIDGDTRSSYVRERSGEMGHHDVSETDMRVETKRTEYYKQRTN